MHLDLSGLRRRHQVRAILADLERCDGHCPTVLMGDCNEWSLQRGALAEFREPWRVLAPGAASPRGAPSPGLTGVVLSPEWELLDCGVHHSALAARGSDHLPVWVRATA